MDLQTNLIAVTIVLISTFLIGAYLMIYNYLKLQKQRLFIEQKNLEMEYDLKRDVYYNSKKNQNLEESESRYIPRLIEEIPFLVEKAITKNTIHIYNDLAKLVETNFQNINNHIKDINWSEETNMNSKQLIREISHSLNTPLSLIEVTIDNILNTNDNSIDIDESLNTIKSSINICKSFLASFRELTLIASSSTIWNPESLSAAVESAVNIYKKKNGKLLYTEVDLPDNIKGFSNNYILSLLLPLIENATESAIPDSAILINHEKLEDTIKLIVTNSSESFPVSENIYISGFTTKVDHDGLGLSIVKHLLESQSDSKLEHNILDNAISFIITLKGQK